MKGGNNRGGWLLAPCRSGRRFSASLAVTAAVVAFVIAAASYIMAGCGPATVQQDGAGAQAADFSGTTLDGVDVSLGAYRGRPLVLAFMASW